MPKSPDSRDDIQSTIEQPGKVVKPIIAKKKRLGAVFGFVAAVSAAVAANTACGLNTQGTGESIDDMVGPDAAMEAETKPIFPTEDTGTGEDADAGIDADVEADAMMDAPIDVVEDALKDAPDDVMVDAKDADTDADADADVMDAPADAPKDSPMDSPVDAPSDAKDADTGDADADADVMDASSDAAMDAEADAGCTDDILTLKNMAEYEYAVFRGGCTDADIVYSSIDPSATFETGTKDLCLKAGDKLVIQVKDPLNDDSFQFFDVVKPKDLKIVGSTMTTPIDSATAKLYCTDALTWKNLNISSDDTNPAADEYTIPGSKAGSSSSFKSHFYRITQ